MVVLLSFPRGAWEHIPRRFAVEQHGQPRHAILNAERGNDTKTDALADTRHVAWDQAVARSDDAEVQAHVVVAAAADGH